MATPLDPDRPCKQKFRASCDACSASKVKCDQALPTCARCTNIGVRCNYSPSRRMGKPPGKGRYNKTPSSESPQAKTPKKRPLDSPIINPRLAHEQISLEQPMPSLDALLFNFGDFMSMQRHPSTLLYNLSWEMSTISTGLLYWLTVTQQRTRATVILEHPNSRIWGCMGLLSLSTTILPKKNLDPAPWTAI